MNVESSLSGSAILKCDRLKYSKSSALLFCMLALGNNAATAQQAIRVHMHGADGYAADGILYQPSSQPPLGAVILIPDDGGVTPRIQDAAIRFAAAGFLTVSIDLNRGVSSEHAQRSAAHTRQDIDAALCFVASQSTIKPGKVAAAGWGAGGLYALQLARESKVRAVLLEDVPLTLDAQGVSVVEAPVLGNVAGGDLAALGMSIAEIKNALHISKAADIKVYQHALHAFDNPDNTVTFREADADDVHRREIQFLQRQLEPDQ